MANVLDILLDEDYDVGIKNGDLDFGFSDQQHIELIVRTYVGHWKEFPLVGVGVDYYLASSGAAQTLRSAMITQFIADGYSVTDLFFDITVDKFEVKTNANRIQQTS